MRKDKGMPGVREHVIQIVQALPDDATADDVLSEIYFKIQVDAGLKELDEGQAISHEAVEKRMARWLSR